MPKFVPRFLLNQQGVIPLVVIVVAGIIGSSGVTVAASQKSIPGDALYGVKQATENVRVAAATSKKDKAKVHLDIAEEKVKEIEKLEEKGATEKITEAAQNLEDSQDQALELTQSAKSEGENVDELVELLEVQGQRQQVVITRISPKIPIQVGESLRKSLEQFRNEVEVVVESDEEDEEEEIEEEDDTEQEEADEEEADEENSYSQQDPCPPSEDEEGEEQEEDNYQEDEEADSEYGWGDYWDSKYLDREEENVNVNEDVEGVSLSFEDRGYSQLRNSQGSSFGRDPCDSAEGSSGAGSRTFDGGAGSSDGIEGDGVSPGGEQGGGGAGTPPSSSPDVEGASTTGLLQLILNALLGR